MIATPLLASLLALGAIASPQRVPSQMHGSINFIAVAPEITQPDAETTWTYVLDFDN